MTCLDELPLALTVEEAAKLLRIGRSAAYGAARSGELPTIRIGRSLRVPRHLLAELLGAPPEAVEPGARAGLDEVHERQIDEHGAG